MNLAELQNSDETLTDCREHADRGTAMDLLRNYMFLRKGNL